MIDLPTIFEEQVRDIIEKVPRLQHIDPDNLLIFSRKTGVNKRGENMGLRHGRQGKVYMPIFPVINYKGRDIRYIINFNPLILSEKLAIKNNPLSVLIHELWHIDTRAVGGLRRMKHGKKFDAIVDDMLEEYILNGGSSMNVLQEDDRIKLRYFKNRKSPSIAYIPRIQSHFKEKFIKKLDWQEFWSEDDIGERTVKFGTLFPKRVLYRCPGGHKMYRQRKISSMQSCAQCSSHFDKRFLFELIESEV